MYDDILIKALDLKLCTLTREHERNFGKHNTVIQKQRIKKLSQKENFVKRSTYGMSSAHYCRERVMLSSLRAQDTRFR